MENYEKSLKLLKFMVGFVVFSVIFVHYIQPKINEDINDQQEQMSTQQEIIEKLKQKTEAEQAKQDENIENPEQNIER